jgi:hypothetical protein
VGLIGEKNQRSKISCQGPFKYWATPDSSGFETPHSLERRQEYYLCNKKSYLRMSGIHFNKLSLEESGNFEVKFLFV